MAGLIEILEWFKTGKKPTQAQFWATWQSFWHKDEQIPQGSVSGLPNALNSKADNAQFNAHKNDPNAHGFNDRFALKEHEHQITDVAGLQEQVEALGRLADEVIRLDENVQILKIANFTLENNMHKATIFCQGTGTINAIIPVSLRQDFICLLYNVGTGNVLPVLEDSEIQSMITNDGAILLEHNKHGILEHFMGQNKFIVRGEFS